MLRALDSGWWAPGPRAKTFERKVARLVGVSPEQVVATASATAALWAATEVLGLTKTPRVCPLTWPATYAAAEDPEWVDCNEQGWPTSTVDIAVELWGRQWRDGQPESFQLCEPLGATTPKILDSAHRFAGDDHSALLNHAEGVKAIVYSFGPQKEVPCWSGGALLMKDSMAAGEARICLNYGTALRERVSVGINGLMNDVQAAFLNEQIKRLPTMRARRQVLLEEYVSYLGKMVLTRPGECSGYLCVIDCKSEAVRRMYRNALVKKPSIQWGHHYPAPSECPQAYTLSRRVLTLPLHIEMSLRDVRRVCARLLQA